MFLCSFELLRSTTPLQVLPGRGGQPGSAALPRQLSAAEGGEVPGAVKEFRSFQKVRGRNIDFKLIIFLIARTPTQGL